jgi:DNA-binding NtrC family response regulator
MGLPSDRVRLLAEFVRHSWEPFTVEEKLDLLAMINTTRGPLDAQTIEKALATTGGNIGLAAKSLSIARRTLQNKMREFNMPTGKGGRPTK